RLEPPDDEVHLVDGGATGRARGPRDRFDPVEAVDPFAFSGGGADRKINGPAAGEGGGRGRVAGDTGELGDVEQDPIRQRVGCRGAGRHQTGGEPGRRLPGVAGDGRVG